MNPKLDCEFRSGLWTPKCGMVSFSGIVEETGVYSDREPFEGSWNSLFCQVTRINESVGCFMLSMLERRDRPRHGGAIWNAQNMVSRLFVGDTW